MKAKAALRLLSLSLLLAVLLLAPSPTLAFPEQTATASTVVNCGLPVSQDFHGIAQVGLDVVCTYGSYVGQNRINLSKVSKVAHVISWSLLNRFEIGLVNIPMVAFLEENGALISTISLPTTFSVIYPPGLPASHIQSNGAIIVERNQAKFQGAFNLFLLSSPSITTGGNVVGKVYSTAHRGLQLNLDSSANTLLNSNQNRLIKLTSSNRNLFGADTKKIIASYNLRVLYGVENFSLADAVALNNTVKQQLPDYDSSKLSASTIAEVRQTIAATRELVNASPELRQLIEVFSNSLGYTAEEYWASSYCFDSCAVALLLAPNKLNN